MSDVGFGGRQLPPCADAIIISSDHNIPLYYLFYIFLNFDCYLNTYFIFYNIQFDSKDWRGYPLYTLCRVLNLNPVSPTNYKITLRIIIIVHLKLVQMYHSLCFLFKVFNTVVNLFINLNMIKFKEILYIYIICKYLNVFNMTYFE